MLDAHIHRVVVVDAGSQRPIGIVSSTDMLAAITRAEAEAAEGVLAEVAMASMAG
jgi:CBS-domain-containing membrane protein